MLITCCEDQKIGREKWQVSTGSTLVEFGELVAEDDVTLHPLFRDRRQTDHSTTRGVAVHCVGDAHLHEP